MNSYPVQASSLISQDPQAQAQDSALLRPVINNAPHVSALPQDTVTLTAAGRAHEAAQSAGHTANATPNKPTPPPHAVGATNSPKKR